MFTSWADLKNEMLNDMASGSWKIKSYATADGLRFEYRDFNDFRRALDYVTAMAEQEAGTTPLITQVAGRARR
ncbi:hypothetical protein [Desulfobotulus sp.]|uniref:hypothetical protein n=1 Tax=Desulfobotulus sp. TaxID=1940337 RepID=UPI002A3636FE|nr:hypothetical protein [Desulfobotulus sp.]MDY0164302.1 hypothetical protein [Desulfobotulus sp.]